MVCACTNREALITDFSKTIQLGSGVSGRKIVGLLLQTELDATAPVTMNIGCKGTVQAKLIISPNETSKNRIDWYSECAEVSFEVGSARPRSMLLSYKFQSL
jgi:hypothetical protein